MNFSKIHFINNTNEANNYENVAESDFLKTG